VSLREEDERRGRRIGAIRAMIRMNMVIIVDLT
jgi:hypothetical protein